MQLIPHRTRGQSGFTLVELMIALVLGLLVVAAAGSMFLSNRRVYASTETVGRIQENQRASFELMTRDIREAGGSPCNAFNQPVNMLQNRTGSFWGTFGGGLSGNDGASGGPDSLDLYTTNEGDIAITIHDNPSAELRVTTNGGVQDNEILMACNADVSIIFSNTHTTSDNKIQHNGSANCGSEFQSKNPDLSKCAGASAAFGYCFVIPLGGKPGPGCSRTGRGPATVVRLSAIRWEVKDNGRGSKSLFRSVFHMDENGLLPTAASTAEVAEGVQDLQFKYGSKNTTAFVDASSITNWKNVTAVQMTLKMAAASGALQGQDLKGTDNNALVRTLTNTVALRNREGLL